MQAKFYRKANTIEDLKGLNPYSEGYLNEYEVVRTVEVEKGEYEFLCQNLILDNKIIIDNDKYLPGTGEDGVRNCLYVKIKGTNEGLLIDNQGYDYARYTAYKVEEKLEKNKEDK